MNKFNVAPLSVKNSRLDGVKLIEPPSYFEDFRGDYVEIYNRELYEAAGIKLDFKQDDYSTSNHGVLRGLHGDDKTWKLVKCVYGSLYLVVVNNDEKSEGYLKWESFCISSQNRLQILIPPKFGNGFLVMSDKAIFHYKQTTYYHEINQFTIKWNDPRIKIWWPINNPIRSERDF
jgi:dTDP-4-dehydrorhamnose 3,5-epimerase